MSDRGRDLPWSSRLLISAILWNLGTWYLGLPASSSHTLIGSIMGVGLANGLIAGRAFGDGVNWGKVKEVFESLLLSPVFGFVIRNLAPSLSASGSSRCSGCSTAKLTLWGGDQGDDRLSCTFPFSLRPSKGDGGPVSVWQQEEQSESLKIFFRGRSGLGIFSNSIFLMVRVRP